MQRARARDQLTLLWRLTVDELTQLSVDLHSFGPDAAIEQIAAVESRLAAARRTLIEVEMALKKLRSGTYGRCDACERWIDVDLLAIHPQHRYCTKCSEPPAAATG
ncbi:MAG TPA: hypothetical protein VFJ98_01940 [Mycobacteriales bacterium]|nr:hypothetical protein [Mycobacteriales bacterium]